MLPIGFKVGGVRAGIYKKGTKKDVAVFISSASAAAAGMFTQCMAKAAPVVFDMEALKNKNAKISAIVANSGCANACTGTRGLKDAKDMAASGQKIFGLSAGSVLVASTGVIGQYLPMDKINNGIRELAAFTGTSPAHEKDSVEAIMTTDTYPKYTSKKIKASGGEITIWACVKGSGMIHPDMKGLHATMLSFILTDAKIEAPALRKSLAAAVEQSFNRVSVDGDTSTNDTIVMLANGLSKAGKLSAVDMKKFQAALDEMTLKLAKEIAADGEGATHMVEIEVKGAKSPMDAKKIAATIATSPLFKTAIFGRDANWGRIMAAAGRAGVKFDPYKADISIGNIVVCKNGMAVDFDEEKAKKILSEKEVKVVLDLKQGKAATKYYTCDMSIDYVKINSDYRS
ncbi:MAG: bifunctional glutamate N-acetyltransferase/amino-acid acetyltransferase ArgJ [Rickettsiales bacterium]|jgi:glutamate N-acetyltransferase/amino-acid N-acetyltransferase|nr:bifunctional glutamate N-acetyltransferase/amino-acid acetyltransferase ArgJ [Rickettsiales bacterium]